MNKDEILAISQDLQKEIKEKYPRYLSLMQKYFPHYLKDPYERYKENFMLRRGLKELTGEDKDQVDVLFETEQKTWGDSETFADYKNLKGHFDFHFISRLKYFKDDDEESRKLAEEMGQENVDFLYDFKKLFCFARHIQKIFDKSLLGRFESPISESYYEDSRVLEFQSEDILITDPCYVIEDDDWMKSDLGRDLDSFGMTKYATKSTLYGDWSCTVFDKDSRKPIGEFCADAGIVSVFSLDEVKKCLNPKIEDWVKEHPWCATILRNYTGKVQIKTGYDKKNYEFYRYVDGEGSINFIGNQTGL